MTTTNKTLAGPVSDCCAQGMKHVGTPVGQKINIGGMDTYISYPPSSSSEKPKKIILAFPDVSLDAGMRSSSLTPCSDLRDFLCEH